MADILRYRDTKRTPTRPTKAKGAIRSRYAHYSINGTPAATHRARYIVSLFPGHTQATYKAMHNALDKYMSDNKTGIVPTKPQILALGIFDGLLD